VNNIAQESSATVAETRLRSGRRIPGLPDYWENYLLCLLFHMLLPLLPLALELWQIGNVSEKSLTLAASMYSIAIGVSSRSQLFFGITIVISIILAVAYGIASGPQQPLPRSGTFAFGSICTVFILHTLERYNRHIVDKLPFLEFKNDGEK